MGIITFNEEAPAKETVHFTFGNSDFDLAPGKEYDTDDVGVLSAASVHPWLAVEVTEPPPAPGQEPDMTDPHVNPLADHLSELASDETKEAAAEAEAQQKAWNAGLEEVPTDTPEPVAAASPVASSVVSDSTPSSTSGGKVASTEVGS